MLEKRTLRNLKHNFMRYLAILMIVILSISVVVGYGNTTFAVKATVEKYWKLNHVEDGEFTVYVPLTKEQTKELHDMGVQLEETYYIDLPAEEGTTLRIFKERNDINKIQMESGHAHPQENEVILEKLYTQDHHFNIGESIQIGDHSYSIVGIGTVADYAHRVAEVSDVGTDILFGLGFVSEETFNEICKECSKDIQVKYNYTYILSEEAKIRDLKKYLLDMTVNENEITDTYIKGLIKDIKDLRKQVGTGFDELEEGSKDVGNGIISLHSQLRSILPQDKLSGMGALEQGCLDLQDGLSEMHEEIIKTIDEEFDYEFNNLYAFNEAETNTRVRDFVESHQAYYMIAIVGGILLSILIAYILATFAVHAIEKDSVVIGTLYAMGYRKSELIKHYIKLPMIVVCVGAVVGTVLGIGLTPYCIMPNYSHMEIATTYPPVLIAYGIGMPIVLVTIINFWVLSRNLNKEPLKLLKKERNSETGSRINIENIGFIRGFQIKQLVKDKKSNLIMLMGLGFAMIIMMLGVSLYTSIKHYSESIVDDMQYDYMYMLKNPLEEQPKHTETAYTKGFSMNCPMAGMDMPVVLQGVEEESRYFDFADQLEDDINKVYISDSAVIKFGYHTGDKVIFTDSLNNKDYAFTIAGTVSFKNGIYFFMNKDAMEEFFDPDGDEDKDEEDQEIYYNTLLSNEVVDVPESMLINVVEKEKVLETARSWVDSSLGIIGLFVGMSIIIFILVMYLLVQNRIEHATFNISLMKVFGFRKKEVGRMYLGSINYVVAITMVVFFPVGSLLMEYLIPAVNATMKSGMGFYMEWKAYLMMAVIIVAAYLVTRILLNRKIDEITLVEILKDRE